MKMVKIISDIEKTKYGLEGKVEFNLFNKTINVLMDEHIDLEYANLCAEALNDMDEKNIDNNPEEYLEWAEDYYDDLEDNLPIKLIEDIFAFKPITKEMIECLNNRSYEEVFEDLRKTGYPVE